MTATRSFLVLKGGEFQKDGGIDYRRLNESAGWGAYQGLAGCLRELDPAALETREQRLAFWINLYNAMVVHGILAAGIPKSVTAVPDFFEATAYEVGGVRLSLEQIEHGVLRNNRPKYLRPWAPLSKDDAALKYALFDLDPRIHFALVCGARSCPPVRVYLPEGVDAQLDLATREFLNRTVKPAADGKGLELSSILLWYEKDFGGREGVLDLLRRLLEPGPARRLLESNPNPRISYADYDWSLNDAS